MADFLKLYELLTISELCIYYSLFYGVCMHVHDFKIFKCNFRKLLDPLFYYCATYIHTQAVGSANLTAFVLLLSKYDIVMQ